jgi:peptidoglycan/xylan/chitin deacetylase (PgdA/CDA1 family)
MKSADLAGWRATPFVIGGLVIVVLAICSVAFRPDLWHFGLITVVAVHFCFTAVGLWPRSVLLGANLVRLPESAALRREVAITIDDGPDPEVTPQVLSILAAYGAQATFFCIGDRAARHPELCRAIVRAGHAVENHGQSHLKRSSLLGPKGWLREVGEAQKTLTAVTGSPPRYFRATAGLRNLFLDPVLHHMGLRLVSWTRRGFDTRTGDAALVLSRLARNLQPGAILLLHDGHAAKTGSGQAVILEVLPALLQELAARKLKTVTVASACLQD